MIKEKRFLWPKINSKIKKAVLKQLDDSISIYDGSGIFSDFEKKFAQYHNRSFAVLFSSGTAAIHAMYVAADLKEGDEVICPAYTFFATVTPLLFLGAKPVLCDCDSNGNIDYQEIEKKITTKTKAVVVTHMWGVPAAMDKISSICKKHKLLLLEDCSHAHGATFNGRVVGSFGDLSAWSLQGAKNITGGEGGIFTTNNRKFYEKSLLLGHYNKRCLKEITPNSNLHQFAVTGMGLKYRPHPLAIAIANEIFLDFEKNYSFRKKYAQQLISSLKSKNFFELIPAYHDKKISPSWYALTFLLKDEYLNKKDIILNKLHKKGLVDIDSPGSTKPLNLLPLFKNPGILFPVYKEAKNKFSYKEGDFPKAERFFNRMLKMPVGVDKDDQSLVNIYIEGLSKTTFLNK